MSIYKDFALSLSVYLIFDIHATINFMVRYAAVPDFLLVRILYTASRILKLFVTFTKADLRQEILFFIWQFSNPFFPFLMQCLSKDIEWLELA